MSEKFSLIFWRKRLHSAWQKCEPFIARWDKRLEKRYEIGKRIVRQYPAFFIALAAGGFLFLVFSLGGSEEPPHKFAILAGAIALVLGAWRSSVATREEKNTRDQIEITTKGQLSDRFAKAVELTSNNNLSIRLGGLAALKSLVEASPDEHERVFTYLCHFLHYPPDLDGWTSDIEKGETQRDNDPSKIPFGRRPDIDAACQMIRERKTEQGTERIVLNLNQACLRRANLQGADLQEANLDETNLQGAYLREANLQRAYLWEANLQKADLQKANLQQAWLQKANLQKALLNGINLQEAKLCAANLQEAWLNGANLQDADLQSAILLSAKLQGANFGNALFGSISSNERQDLSAVKDLKQLENTFYGKDSPEPILDKNLEGKLDRSIHLIPVSIEEWIQHLLRAKL